ncbi:MAG: hypothetical protein R3B74_09220 [Nitrospirales bacterium]|nr:hypothetical protein [Nitrospirales bacterium]
MTQAVFLYGVGCSTLLGLGVFYGEWTGLYVGLLAVVFGLILQTTWLGKKSTPFLSPAPMETAVNDGKS